MRRFKELRRQQKVTSLHSGKGGNGGNGGSGFAAAFGSADELARLRGAADVRPALLYPPRPRLSTVTLVLAVGGKRGSPCDLNAHGDDPTPLLVVVIVVVMVM